MDIYLNDNVDKGKENLVFLIKSDTRIRQGYNSVICFNWHLKILKTE